MPDNPRDELRATVEARRDLGPDYENALIESFLDKLDTTIDARVRAAVATQNGHPDGYAPPLGGPQPAPGKHHAQRVDPSLPIALGSLGIGVPLTAIAAAGAGPGGLFLAWTGIVLVNVAAAFGRRKGR
ncbi:hypothetical protein [Sphaerisporangium krabiense]|uniref:Uncharacterized protein n=1 Tax=Sphaerisporangium krabiense TaxID=763782 RepID=A0A7W8ZC81_9ACTN|nr:hypothetical protein [Sphaerisporangium krabiense]MBB5631339.1 hypothetical protein [Sphaerisporangium krabiense]